MDYRRYSSTIILRLDKGDEIIECLKQVAKAELITAASVSGIGAAGEVSGGIFDVPNRQYSKHDYTGIREITGLNGNISTMDGEVYIHAHMNCAGADGNVVGGHLIRCVVGLTAEIFIQCADAVLDRRRDESVGLNVFNFS